MENGIERLRMFKMCRTPQALRSFARIFTFILPPFCAPAFAQVAMEVQSSGIGIAFGLVTALGLMALFESLQVLEDPFVTCLASDGTDVREDFGSLLFSSLINTRKFVLPHALSHPVGQRSALSVAGKGVERRPPSTVFLGRLLFAVWVHKGVKGCMIIPFFSWEFQIVCRDWMSVRSFDFFQFAFDAVEHGVFNAGLTFQKCAQLLLVICRFHHLKQNTTFAHDHFSNGAPCGWQGVQKPFFSCHVLLWS